MIGKRGLGAMLLAGVFVVSSAGAAFAGEITGNGKSLQPLHARSWCAFSGLDDADDDGFDRTQSWGQIPKAEREFLTEIGFSPGVACNAHLNPYSPDAEH